MPTFVAFYNYISLAIILRAHYIIHTNVGGYSMKWSA